jgi:hypothetical protein
MEKLEDPISIFGSSLKVWGVATIPGEQPKANL